MHSKLRPFCFVIARVHVNVQTINPGDKPEIKVRGVNASFKATRGAKYFLRFN